MDKERRRSLPEATADYVREQVLQEKLTQREKLVENDIAVKLGMSWGPVRDTLKQLIYEGFLDYETNKGYSASMFSPKDTYEIFFLCGSLEDLALKRCGGRLLSDSIFLMEGTVLAMEEIVAEDDMRKIIKYDEMFHKQILLSGQMERLTSLWEILNPLNGAIFYTVKQIGEYVSEMQVDLDQEDTAAQAGRRGNSYLEYKWFLEVLQWGSPERSRGVTNSRYITSGERTYRAGMRMENQELFYHV